MRANATTLLIGLTLGAGCAAPKSAAPVDPMRQQTTLNSGYSALEAKQYNDAVASADQFLKTTPHGPGSAAALYLKGRALEAKDAAGVSDAQSKANLQAARDDYIQALEQNPSQPLAAYIRTSLANVAYFQDDYATAISQWQAAYDKLNNDDLKAWALYRIGVSQQRLSRFAEADATFAQVEHKFPGTVATQRAKEHSGARAFYVQLATFANAGLADRAIAELARQGVRAARTLNSRGQAIVRIGPVGSYRQAEYYRNQLERSYPDALVLP